MSNVPQSDFGFDEYIDSLSQYERNRELGHSKVQQEKVPWNLVSSILWKLLLAIAWAVFLTVTAGIAGALVGLLVVIAVVIYATNPQEGAR